MYKSQCLLGSRYEIELVALQLWTTEVEGKKAVLSQQDAATWAQKLSLFMKVQFGQKKEKEGERKQQAVQIQMTNFRNDFFFVSQLFVFEAVPRTEVLSFFSQHLQHIM